MRQLGTKLKRVDKNMSKENRSVGYEIKAKHDPS